MKFGKYVINKQTDGGFKAMKVNSKEAKQINSQNDMLKKSLVITSGQILRPASLDRLEGSENYAFRGRNGTLSYLTV